MSRILTVGAAQLGPIQRVHSRADVIRRLIELMRITGIPNGVGGVGYGTADLPTLAAGAWAQQRLVRNAPKAVDEAGLGALFGSALRYW